MERTATKATRSSPRCRAQKGETKDETSRYTDLQADGKSLMFTYPMDVKSLIARPSPGLTLPRPGLYEVSGLAWSGSGAIAKVEVSADGGQTWAEAALTAPVLPRALTRFRIPWKWNGAPAVMKSRATDSTGEVQPTRDRLVAEHGTNVLYADFTATDAGNYTVGTPLLVGVRHISAPSVRVRGYTEKCRTARWQGENESR